MEQQYLFNDPAPDASKQERDAYDKLAPIIEAVCLELNIHSDKFRLREGVGYSSVYYGDCLVMQLKIRGKSYYISVPKAWLSDLPPEVEWTERKSDNGRIRLAVGTDVEAALNRLGAPIIRAAILHIPKEFDCCSRFEQCSDAMRCIHPDPEFALLCGYRKILATGRVFCGKNRNV